MRLPERLLALLALCLCTTAGADPIDLKPFRATYTAEWKGMTAARSTLELRRGAGDQYTYSSVNEPRGVFRMALPDSLTQISTFRLVEGRVQPLSFRGSDEKERPIDLTFDWTHMRVTGVAKEKKVDLALVPGTQDAMSLQIASLRDLAAARVTPLVWMMDGDKLKEYELRLEGNARIETELGDLDTVVYTSRRANSDRLTRTWVAPALGYLPVRAERIRGKKTEITLLIESVER
jgi:hypothetical protein